MGSDAYIFDGTSRECLYFDREYNLLDPAWGELSDLPDAERDMIDALASQLRGDPGPYDRLLSSEELIRLCDLASEVWTSARGIDITAHHRHAGVSYCNLVKRFAIDRPRGCFFTRTTDPAYRLINGSILEDGSTVTDGYNDVSGHYEPEPATGAQGGTERWFGWVTNLIREPWTNRIKPLPWDQLQQLQRALEVGYTPEGLAAAQGLKIESLDTILKVTTYEPCLHCGAYPQVGWLECPRCGISRRTYEAILEPYWRWLHSRLYRFWPTRWTVAWLVNRERRKLEAAGWLMRGQAFDFETRDYLRQLYEKTNADLQTIADRDANVRYAADCPPCPNCGEPWCPECQDHYATCACPGPHSEPEGETDA